MKEDLTYSDGSDIHLTEDDFKKMREMTQKMKRMPRLYLIQTHNP